MLCAGSTTAPLNKHKGCLPRWSLTHSFDIPFVNLFCIHTTGTHAELLPSGIQQHTIVFLQLCGPAVTNNYAHRSDPQPRTGSTTPHHKQSCQDPTHCTRQPPQLLTTNTSSPPGSTASHRIHSTTVLPHSHWTVSTGHWSPASSPRPLRSRPPSVVQPPCEQALDDTSLVLPTCSLHAISSFSMGLCVFTHCGSRIA